jgi:hypothetical protein
MAQDPATPPLTDLSVDMPRPNFPLPRELRDQIYGYLLDSKYTRIKRTYDAAQYKTTRDSNLIGPRAYHFHTNILAVNQEIHNESKELLYKRNIFVVISYQWPQLNIGRGGLACIPIVSNKHIATMTLHSVRIHVSQTKATKNNTFTEAPRHSFLLLAKDLEAFRCAMHAPAACAAGPYVWVAARPSSEPLIGTTNIDDHGIPHKPTQLLCEFKDTKYRSMDSPTQHDILGPISSIISPSQRVVFTGSIHNIEEVELARRIMSPTLLCSRAHWWSDIQNLTVVKTIADASIEHDDPSLVLHQYTIIQHVLAGRMEGMEKPSSIHDLEILKRHANQDDIITIQHLPFEQCSAYQLPLPGTSFYETIDSMSWKSHYHGFHDLDLLRSLSDDQRKTINDLQKRYRLGVTDFDLL